MTKAPVKQYVLANPHAKCRVHYRKETLTVKHKVSGKEETVRMVGCAYVKPKKASPVAITTTTVAKVTTTTVAKVTTTTLTQVLNQAMTTTYDSFNSYVTSFPVPNGSPPLYIAQEYADVSVTGLPDTSPSTGTVTFTDSAGRTICVAQLSYDPPSLQTNCGTSLSSLPINPITATYSGTASGVNDGRGSTYGGSSGIGSPG